MEALANKQGEALSKKFLYQLLWPDGVPETVERTFWTHVRNLRLILNDKQIEEKGKKTFKIIKTTPDGLRIDK